MTIQEFAKSHGVEVQVTRNRGGGSLKRFKCELTGTAVYMGPSPSPTYGYAGSTNGALRTYVGIIRGKRMELFSGTQGRKVVIVPGDLTA